MNALPPRAPGGDWRVRVAPVTTEDGFFAMEREWTALVRESASNTVFLTWEWAAAWWKAYGASRPLCVLRVERDGRVIGIAPLYRRTLVRYRVFAYRALTIVGDGSADSDYLDWIARRGEEDAVAQAVVDWLAGRADWDLLLLNEVPERSPNLPILRRLCDQRGWRWDQRPILCAVVELPSDWETYLRRLQPRMRTKLRSLAARFEQRFKVQIDVCRDHGDLRSRLDSLYELHTRRWRLDGQEGVFVRPAKRRFYEEMASRFLSRGWLRFYSMSADGRVVAHQFCFEYQKKMFLLQEAFDPTWVEHGIGNVLRAHVFRDCIARGVKAYDFLGGVTPHKLSWGATMTTSLRASIGRPSLNNLAYFDLPRGLALAKRIVKAVWPRGRQHRPAACMS